MDEVPKFPQEYEERYFPGGFTTRDEANAIVAYAVRNGPIEDLHAGMTSELLENDELSRLTQEDIKRIMIYASNSIEELLRLKEANPEEYTLKMLSYNIRYCRGWKREKGV